MTIADRLAGLRRAMAEKNVNTYIILSSDAHQSEYVGDYWKARAYMSGFTGSAGTETSELTEVVAGISV